MTALPLRVLRAIEWSHEHGACPVCRACRRCDEMDGRAFTGHRPDCELAAAIRELEAAEAPASRDPFTDPRRGDWFVDQEGDLVEVTATPRFIPHVWRTDKRVTTPGPQTVEEFERWVRGANARPMTPVEILAFGTSGTRPTWRPS